MLCGLFLPFSCHHHNLLTIGLDIVSSFYWPGGHAEFRAGSSKMMEIEYYYTTSAGVLLFPSYYLCCSCEEIRDGHVDRVMRSDLSGSITQYSVSLIRCEVRAVTMAVWLRIYEV